MCFEVRLNMWNQVWQVYITGGCDIGMSIDQDKGADRRGRSCSTVSRDVFPRVCESQLNWNRE